MTHAPSSQLASTRSLRGGRASFTALLLSLPFWSTGCAEPTTATWTGGVLRHSGAGEYGAEDGEWVFRYESGQERERGEFENGRKVGVWTQYWRNGQRASEGERRPADEGLGSPREGAWRHWHENGVLAARGSYTKGLREGAWEFFDDQGVREDARCGEYRADILVP